MACTRAASPVPEIRDTQFSPCVARNAASAALRPFASSPAPAFHAAFHSHARTRISRWRISATIIPARTAAVTARVPAAHWAIRAAAAAMAAANAAWICAAYCCARAC